MCHIHTSVHPSNRPSRKEGGRFAKEGKIPEQRHRAQEGPYMGMGTVFCFPADECAAALAPPQPPTRHQASHQHHCQHRAEGFTTVPPLPFREDGNLRYAGHCQGTGPALPATALPAHCLLVEGALTSTPKAPGCPHMHSDAPLPLSQSHPWYPLAPHTEYQQYNCLHPTHTLICPPPLYLIHLRF